MTRLFVQSLNRCQLFVAAELCTLDGTLQDANGLVIDARRNGKGMPVFAAMGAWGRRFLPVSEELSIRAELLEKGGPQMWEDFMAELRAMHLGAAAPQRSVFADLRKAYEDVLAAKAVA